ncbi:hypothetical protein [Mucilaginibacter sp.]|uniref:hypothetical protein n=1 Tax=Mucilaginibacter sp. TaxID=1882438 RepID=UPI00261F8147|nr:hypothetical protein [Mucilaginibacter sp.]MDB4919503.1 hypothetical protein [Mucilaginibacter sp.]
MEINLNHASFRISTSELEISGPVDFVKEQVQFNKNIIDFFAENIKQGLIAKETLNAITFNDVERTPLLKTSNEYADFEEMKESDSILAKYKNVIAINGDKVQILTKIPGNSTGAKMLKLLLVYLYIKFKISLVEKVSSVDLRNFCEMHGELDAGHFSAYLKKNKKWFLLDGNGKYTNVIITVPGMKEAEQILDAMNNQN